jgi:uncharacterized protein YndB with AHSA1/START domain
MDLRFEVYGKIARPVAEVFDAVYNPRKLSGYFTTGGASGPLTQGSSVTWDFADFPGAFPVHVRQVESGRLIEPIDDGSTLVRISESGWKETPEGLRSSYGNCSGWMHMLCCLKVYVEHGINLRAFFF